MMTRDQQLDEMERTLSETDAMLKTCPSYGGAALGGALLGVLTNFVASRRFAGGVPGVDRHLLRYAVAGAAVGAAVEWASCKAGRGLSDLEHRAIREVRAARLASALPPPSPVVTKGHFAGAPRPLYHATY